MIIKTRGAELEISDKSGIYLGLREKGQIFKNRDELSDYTIAALLTIRDKAEDLVRQAEQLLSEWFNTSKKSTLCQIKLLK